VKFACSSTAFDEALRALRLTQLEWIDLCANELGADGIVLDARHFPRTDTDYLAQVKKMAVDLGLTVAAFRHDGFFSAGQAHREQALETALALGAPILTAPLPPETAAPWTDVLAMLGDATSAAKRLNVTIALRNAPGTHAAGAHDMKRVAKEADSAWLRFAPDPAMLEAGSNVAGLLVKAVLVWSDVHVAAFPADLTAFRGFVALDAASGTATAPEMNNALRQWRTALFEAANRT
jgi:sugar phosphate isomerase/epimerase